MKSSISDLNELLKKANGENKSLQNQFKKSQKEKSESVADATALKAKVETLKNEKRDLEKTLEKEIRDKTELQTQVTNILQEIGRLEEQLKEVKQSHADIENEKRALEEKTAKLKTAHQEAKAKGEKEQSQALNEKIKEFETKVKDIECENSQLAEKNCLLEEANARLQNSVRELEANVKTETQNVQQLTGQIAALRIEFDSARDENGRIQDKLKQSLDDHTELFNMKEQMDQENRSLLDQLETKEKEKLCLINTNETFEADLARLKQQNEQQTTLEEEKQHLSTVCDTMRQQLDTLRIDNENLSAIKTDLENEIQSLRASVKQFTAEKLPLESELERLRLTLSELEGQNTELDNSLKESEVDRDSLKESLKNLVAVEERLESLEQIKIENEYLNKSIKQNDSELSAFKEQNIVLESEVADLKEKLKSQQCELYVLQEDKSKQVESFERKDQEIDQLKSICQRSQTFNEELQNELKQHREQFDALKMLNDELHKDKGVLDGKHEKLLKEIQECKQSYETQTEALKQETAKLERLESDHKTSIADLEQKKGKLTELEGQLFEYEKTDQKVTELQDTLSEKSKQLAEIEEKSNNLQKEIDSSRAIISDLNKDLNHQVEKLEAAESQTVDLQGQLLAVQTQLAEKTATPDDVDTLRRSNEQLQYELAELRRNNEREVSDLNHEIDELHENARAYREGQKELEGLKASNVDLLKKLESLRADQEVSVKNVSHLNATVSARGDDANDEALESLRLEKADIEGKLNKILSEVQDVSNRNLFLEQKCENYLILEQSNERLKLQNSKLSRQLDETLVSLNDLIFNLYVKLI